MNPWLVGVRSPLGCGCNAGLTARLVGSKERLAVPLERVGGMDSKGFGVAAVEARGVAWSDGPERVANVAEGERVGDGVFLPDGWLDDGHSCC